MTLSELNSTSSTVTQELNMAQNELPERDALSEEREAVLLAGDNEQDESSNADSTTALMAMMATMNENMTTVLKRLSRVEVNAGKPPKQRRIVETTEHEGSRVCEGEISVSENLATQTTGGKDGDEILSEIAQDFDNAATTGPSVSQKPAEIINKHWSLKLEEAKLKTKMEKYDRPDDCEKLIVPKVNPEIWATLNHSTRGSDLKIVNSQKTFVKVGIAKLTPYCLRGRNTLVQTLN